MPIQDYSSTARALASPVSSPTSPTHERPPFRRIASHASHRRDVRTPRKYQERALQTAMAVKEKMISTYLALSIAQRIGTAIFLLVVNIILVLMFIYGSKITSFLKPFAEGWRDMTGGWAILWSLIFVTAFPPLFGYSTLITTCGFVFGFWKGWIIASSAATIGSLVSFIACRTVLSKYVHGLVGEDKRFKALALTLKHDGLGTLTLIRWCPLPYSLSNGALSTIPTIQPLAFAMATAFSTPKLMIHVFIGTRLGSLAEDGDSMDRSTKIINYASIAGFSILGATLGYIIYNRTKARAVQLEEEERRLAGGEDGLGGAEGMLDPTQFDDGGTGMDDDDISLWDTSEDGYRDEDDGEGRKYKDSDVVGTAENGRHGKS